MSFLETSNVNLVEAKYYETELRICRGLKSENVNDLPGSLKASQIEKALEKAQNKVDIIETKVYICSIISLFLG